jgi:hypothetical protein
MLVALEVIVTAADYVCVWDWEPIPSETVDGV